MARPCTVESLPRTEALLKEGLQMSRALGHLAVVWRWLLDSVDFFLVFFRGFFWGGEKGIVDLSLEILVFWDLFFFFCGICSLLSV